MVWNIRAPHGLIESPSVPASRASHSDPGDRSGVADQLPGQLRGRVGRKELGRLDLLQNQRRLGLRTRPRIVIGRERQEDDETQQHREPGGQHPEDARGAVPIGEIASLRGPAAHQQHRRDRDRRGGDQHQKSYQKIHGALLWVARPGHPVGDRRDGVGTSGVSLTALAGRELTHPCRRMCRDIHLPVAVVAPGEGLAARAKLTPDRQHPLGRVRNVLHRMITIQTPEQIAAQRGVRGRV
jgi:hypothetical protein